MVKYSLVVIDGKTRSPFLRGILTHSLLKRGLDFKQAYQIANTVRERFRKKNEVLRQEIRKTVDSIIEKEYGSSLTTQKPVLPNSIYIKGKGEVPLSKGILARSLTATGLEPSTAYATAVEIQKKLLIKNSKFIGRRQLRKVVYEELLHTHGQDLADRYLVWRYLGSPKKPVVLLIGGTSGAGKTSLGGEVAHRLGIGRIVTTDSVREIMRLMFSNDLLPTLHYSSYEAWKAWPAGNDPLVDGAVDAFMEQSTRVNVGIKALVDRAFKERHSLALEGVHLVPGLLDYHSLSSKAYCVHIVLANFDPAIYVERFPKREAQEKTRFSQKYLDNLDVILQIQDYILEMAHLHKIPIIESQDAESSVMEMITTVTDNLREQLNLGGEKLVERTL